MTRLLYRFLAMFALLAGAVAPDANTIALGRRLTELFYARKFEPVWQQMAEGQRKELGSIQNLAKFRESVATMVGSEVEVVAEEVVPAATTRTYSRRVKYEKSAEVFDVTWTFDTQGKVSDFSIRPTAPATEFKYQTKTRLTLPVEGDWYVASGGRTPEQNGNHYYDYKWRFDSDLVRVEDVRFDRENNPRHNEDFAAFGRPVLAPAGGRIANLRDGVPDNVPGQINEKPEERPGNFVMIDHGNGEFSLLAHLRKGSVKLRLGERVTRGQQVGECGNSGNSSGPHLHYGLHRTSDPAAGMSLPAQFVDYVADREQVERGELVRGERISRRK